MQQRGSSSFLFRLISTRGIKKEGNKMKTEPATPGARVIEELFPIVESGLPISTCTTSTSYSYAIYTYPRNPSRRHRINFHFGDLLQHPLGEMLTI